MMEILRVVVQSSRNIREGQVGLYFLEAHNPSRVMNLQEIWHKNG